MLTKEKLVDIQTLLEWLGYEDVRSVRAWCKKNKIPLFDVGRRTYTIATFIDAYIEAELSVFVNENYANPSQVMTAVKGNDKVELLKLTESSQTQVIEKAKMKINKSEMSKASKNLLSKLKSA